MTRLERWATAMLVIGTACAEGLHGQDVGFATLVTADTMGIAFVRQADSLFVFNRTWARTDSASALPDCVYSGKAQRMLARDSMRLTVATRGWRWRITLKPGEAKEIQLSFPFGPLKLTILDVSAPMSVCGVNAGQVWFHWTLERAVELAEPDRIGP